MNKETKGNLILSGNGQTGGGLFESVVINGNGTVNGDIECEDFQCQGLAKVKGHVRSKQCVIKGNTSILGNLDSNNIEIHGNSKIKGNATFKKMVLKGNSKLHGCIKGEELSIEGMIKIGGDCEVDSANLKGAFSIDGLMNADHVDVQLYGRSSVKEIGGETITVRRESNVIFNLDKWIKALRKELQTDLIEGDVVNIEYTKATMVRGNNVFIGPGCEIDKVEYRSELKMSEDAIVHSTTKI